MKKRFLIAAGLVAATVAACGGKVVVESSGAAGTGGAGGTASTVSTADGAPDPTTGVTVGVSTVAATAVAATSVTTGTGAGGCDPSYTCAEAITPPQGDPSKLCDGPSGQLYDALVQCVCVDACAIQCGGNACAGEMPKKSCNDCLQDTVNGCGNQFNACANDI